MTYCFLGQVQRAWAKSIYKAKSEPSKAYVAMRVRITLRKTGVMASEDQIKALIQKEMTAPAKPEIGRSDILHAMLQGQEVYFSPFPMAYVVTTVS